MVINLDKFIVFSKCIKYAYNYILLKFSAAKHLLVIYMYVGRGAVKRLI